jgi:predicted phage terminase large subunit-like protein
MSSAVEFTEDEIQLMLDNLDAYSPEEQAEIDKIADILTRRQVSDTCQNDLIAFCQHMQPDYKVGKHHRVLADLLMQIAGGEKDRVCVNIPPRHGKSHRVSTYFPAWFIGKYPDKKVLMVSHTTDLAVDFGRKVRNIIDSERFKDIFPEITLAIDSKSAGRWNTNRGGEYFACIRRYAVICTERGAIPAGQVRVGDRLLNAGGYVTVQEVFDSEHSATYNVAGLHCSAKHPVWTANRGWVEAQYLCASDVLCVASISDKIRFFLRGIRNGYVGHSDVSSLVQHKESVHQPQQREVGELRGAWNHFVRAVAYIRTFFGRHGATTDSAAYRGAYRQRWSVQSGELSLGGRNTAAEQQAQQSDFGWAYVGATCAGYGAYTRGNSVPTQSGNPAGGPKAAEEELRAYGSPENTGRARRAAACILTRRRRSVEPRQPNSSLEMYLARARETTQQLFGFLLGVRRVGSVRVTLHPEPKHFVNFLTDEDHTFFADGVLTHNCGVGSALAGRGADLLLVDDPHNEQDVINGNFGVFEKAYEWFTYGARTRLMPGGRVAIVQCMTGDTPVLMSNGEEKPLRDVRPGDQVATYDNGVLSTSTVLNHRSNGPDRVFTIKTTCGKVVHANERHPFLVETNGVRQWTRLRDLRVGDSVVSLRGANALRGLKPSPASAKRASRRTPTIEKTLMPHAGGLGIGANTGTCLVHKTGAQSQRMQEGYAAPTTTKCSGDQENAVVARKVTERPILNTGTESRRMSIARCLSSKTVRAPYVNSLQVATTLALTGTANYALITATILGKFVDSCVMTVTSLWDTVKQKLSCAKPQNTYEFTASKVSEIAFVGVKEVFDVQIKDTENFIANGLVSHNTRWHQDDLTGRVTRDMAQNDQADQYEVVEFPAIMEVPDPDDADAIIEKPLWPEFFDLTALHRTKASMPTFQWNAQYQQNPTAEEASIVKREWWNVWSKEDPPDCEYIIVTLDAAAETHNRADFTAMTTWGVFFNEERDGPGANAYNIILLDSIKRRMEFPELKETALQAYKEWKPDAFIVEKKSSGTALYQELRRTGLAVSEYTPHRGSGDKMARLNSVADIVRSRICWVPQTRWAEELVEEVAGFPFMANDDLVDTTTMALMRFRQGGFVRLPTDELDDVQYFKSRSGGSKYY